jgi:general secretion pathway protein M
MAALLPLQGLLTPWQARWRALSVRERRLVVLAAAAVALALFWLGLLRPALRTLRSAPAEIAALQTTLRRVQTQSRQLTELNAAPAVTAHSSDLRADVGAWLQAHDPAAQVEVQALPGSATLQIRAMSPRTLLPLAQAARHDWGAALSQAHLTRGADGLFAGSIELTLLQDGS